MWFGSGGWLAAAVGTWTIVWALRWAGDRRWQGWAGTAIAGLATGWCLALASVHMRLILSVAKVAVSPGKKQTLEAAELFVGAYGPLWMPLVFGALAVGALWWSRQSVQQSSEEPGLWWLALLVTGLPALVSTVALGVVDRVFISVDPATIDIAAGRVAMQLLRAGLISAWFGIVGGAFWALFRGIVRFRKR